MTPCDYSFVVLSRNRRAKLAMTLDRLAQLSGPSSYEVIVVDNASTDGTPAMLREQYPGVQLISSESNLGISAWNEGFKVAKGRWLFVLDDDSLPISTHILSEFAAQEARLDPAAGICAFDVFWDEAGTDSWSSGWLERSLTFIGCGAALRREMVEAIGGFDSQIFVYAHELEYSLNAQQHGYRLVYMPEIRIWHNSDKRTRFDDFWMYNTTWSSVYTVLKWMPWPDLIKGAALFSFLYFRPALRTHTLAAWGRANVRLLRTAPAVLKHRTPLAPELHRHLSEQWLDSKSRPSWQRWLLKGVWVA